MSRAVVPFHEHHYRESRSTLRERETHGECLLVSLHSILTISLIMWMWVASEYLQFLFQFVYGDAASVSLDHRDGIGLERF